MEAQRWGRHSRGEAHMHLIHERFTLPWWMSLMFSASQPSLMPASLAAAISFTFVTDVSGSTSTGKVTPFRVLSSHFIVACPAASSCTRGPCRQRKGTQARFSGRLVLMGTPASV